MTDDFGTPDDWIARLRSPDAAWRRSAAEVLGDWVYPHGGLPAEQVRSIHQALLDAALIETDADARLKQLMALTWSNRPLLDLEGWEALVERTPDFPSEAQDHALALLSISGEPAFADRLEALATEHRAFDHALTRKTIEAIRRTTGQA